LAKSQQKIILEIEPGQDLGRARGNGIYQISYSSLPEPKLEDLDSLDDLFGKFIDLAGSLIAVDTTDALVRPLMIQCREVGKILHDWLVERLPELKSVLAGLSANDRLTIRADESLMALPWELLFDGDRFLVNELPLIRQAIEVPPLAEEELSAGAQLPLPLRILAISYSSPGLRIDSEEHWENVEKSLEGLTNSRLADLRRLNEDELFEFLDYGTLPEDIQDINILHILAHGTSAPDDKGDVSINLGDKPYSGEALADIIIERLNNSRLNPNLRLVIMASCKSARRNKSGLVKSLTQAMLRKRVPAVVAMQYDISLEAAAFFVAGIYRGLADGKPLDFAMQDGRDETSHLSGTIEWATPVLYTLLDDLTLFAPLTPKERKTRQQYLASLRTITPHIKEFFPIEVIAIEEDDTTNSQETRGGSSSRVASMGVNPDNALQRRFRAETLLKIDNKRLPQQVTILLGDTGGGKSAIIDQFLWNLIPPLDGPELSPELREFAYHPASYIPIRLSFKRVGTDEYGYRLRSLVRQGMATIWSERPDEALPLPSEQEIVSWSQAGWTFLVILEDLQTIPDQDRERVSLYLYNLIQRNSQDHFILTGTVDSFADFAMNLGQFPRWQTVALSTQLIQEYIERENLPIEDEGLINLVRQPWAFGTLKAMVNQGQVAFSQASLLQGRIDHQLNQLPDIRELFLAGRVRLTLINTARSMKDLPRAELSVDEFFALMKKIRGERTYNLEQLFATLLSAGILTAVDRGETQMIQFRDAYIFSILFALAMTDVLPTTPDFVTNYDLKTPDARLALILMTQLNNENMELIVLGLMERLRDSSLKNDWDSRIDLLDLVVQCAGTNFGGLKQDLRVTILQELCCCLLKRKDEVGFRKWLMEQSFTGIPEPLEKMTLNGKRISSPELRTHVLELLVATKAPQAYEILRWFVMEPAQWNEPEGRMADSKMRQKALQLLREQWQLAQKQTDSLLIQFLGQDALESLHLLLQTWTNVRKQRSTTDRSSFNLLIEWMQGEKPLWRSSASAVALADIGARQPAWAGNATMVLVDQFLNTTDENAIWLISESLALLPYLPADNVELQRIAGIMAEIAVQKPEKRTDEIGKLRQETAVATLGRLKAESALGTLINIIEDHDQYYRVRARATWAISKICVEYPQHPQLDRARLALMEEAKSTTGWPQREAIIALGFFGADTEIPAVLLEIKASLKAGDPDDQKRYTISLIEQSISRCEMKCKPGYSLSPSLPV
jgi:hypothetical protein